ncbi:MAG: cupin domain-containing protein [Kiritimatiellae bacterium]|nr:cupin domain-containing protein [Kiritimatiellia bacterium]
MNTAEAWIKHLNLVEHPEGGFFHENYRSDESIPKSALPSRYRFDHAFGTAIYYMLAGNDFSAFHRVASDEIWHFYDGTSILLHMLNPDWGYRSQQVGVRPEDGAVPQLVVPKGTWMAAELVDKTSFCLVGCTVAPGFDFSDFEMARPDKLVAQFPEREAVIHRLTRTQQEIPDLLNADGQTDDTHE